MRRATALLARREQAALAARRGFAGGASDVKKVLVALYPDATTPQAPARDSVPKITGYANGATAPTPKGLDFVPGALVGSKSGELGLRKFLEARGIELVVTTDKDGPGCEFEKHLPTADVVISQPFWPAYMTAERIAASPRLKLAITAGIGSDHVDLAAACARKIAVLEVTGSNSVSVAEHEVMALLALVRNFIPAHDIARRGGWNIADCVARSYDLEGMEVGTIGAGRIGLAVMRRLKPFDVKLHYSDPYRLKPEVEAELNATYHATPESLAKSVDAVLLNCPLHPGSERMFDAKMLQSMRRGAYIVNNARGKLADTQAVADALKSGHLGGYAGDVWFPQPALPDHPWRTMPHNAMTPHISGTSLSAQARYAAGTREILECFLDGSAIRPEYYIVKDGKLAGAGAVAYQPGTTTGGSEVLGTTK